MKLQYMLLGLLACTPAPAPPPAPIDLITVVSDDFTDPAGTDLKAHSTITGQQWTAFPDADPLVINADGRVATTAITANGAVYWVRDWAPSSPDYTISATLLIVAQEDGAEAGLLAARGQSFDHGVGLGLEVFENTYRLVLGTAGRSVASTAATLEPGTHSLTLRFAGDTAFGAIDSVTLRMRLGPELAQSGPVGLFGYLEAPPIGGGLQFDNYIVSIP